MSWRHCTTTVSRGVIAAFFSLDHWWEVPSLQRRVHCEPDFLDQGRHLDPFRALSTSSTSGSTPTRRRCRMREDLREVIGAYHRGVAETVGRLGGFVAKYMGDGVRVYFGYPNAHEDDAEDAPAGSPVRTCLPHLRPPVMARRAIGRPRRVCGSAPFSAAGLSRGGSGRRQPRSALVAHRRPRRRTTACRTVSRLVFVKKGFSFVRRR